MSGSDNDRGDERRGRRRRRRRRRGTKHLGRGEERERLIARLHLRSRDAHLHLRSRPPPRSLPRGSHSYHHPFPKNPQKNPAEIRPELPPEAPDLPPQLTGTGGMAEGLLCPRGMASSLAVCHHGGPHVATLQVGGLRRRFSRRACGVVSGSLDGPSEFSRGAALFCGWARRQTVSALRWGGQLWCLPSPPVSFEAGEFVEQWAFLPHWQATVKRRGLVFILSSLIVTGALASFALQPSLSLTEENLLFLEAWRTVDRAYVDKSFNGQSWFRYREDALKKEPMKTREETYAAIRKMLATLDDPFTRFLEPEKFKSLQSGTNGAVTGVGLEVGFNTSDSSTSNEDLVVVSPVSGGPAARAGVVPGDLIMAIDGVPTHGMGLYDAARRLQGPVQSEVQLTLLKKESTAPKTITVLREKITLNPVTWRLCEIPQKDGSAPLKLGYIRLSTFNQNSSSAVKNAIETLQESGAAAFILDIRNNSGGLFPSGVEIAKMWLDKGVIVYIADSMGVRDIYDTDGGSAISTKEPLVVLVNKGTASASEILAGALKDNKRAVILGEPTFGKGRIQSVFQLSDGSGMAVTIARYETPAHINIDKVGITPDRPLPAALPMDEGAFCRCLEDASSDCNLTFTSLFSG